MMTRGPTRAFSDVNGNRHPAGNGLPMDTETDLDLESEIDPALKQRVYAIAKEVVAEEWKIQPAAALIRERCDGEGLTDQLVAFALDSFFLGVTHEVRHRALTTA